MAETDVEPSCIVEVPIKQHSTSSDLSFCEEALLKVKVLELSFPILQE